MSGLSIGAKVVEKKGRKDCEAEGEGLKDYEKSKEFAWHTRPELSEFLGCHDNNYTMIAIIM